MLVVRNVFEEECEESKLEQDSGFKSFIVTIEQRQ